MHPRPGATTNTQTTGGILGKKRTARRMNPEANSQRRLSPAEKREFPVGLRLTPHTLNLRQAELFQPPAHINSHVPKHADLILLQLPPTHTPHTPPLRLFHLRFTLQEDLSGVLGSVSAWNRKTAQRHRRARTLAHVQRKCKTGSESKTNKWGQKEEHVNHAETKGSHTHTHTCASRQRTHTPLMVLTTWSRCLRSLRSGRQLGLISRE